MERRTFLGAGAALAAGAVAMPAVAQSMPEVKWRMTSSFPKSLDILYGGAEVLAKLVSEATDGRFQIQVFAPGEVVPALQALDAAQNGTVEVAHTASYYYVGKDPTFAFASAVPFGLNARQQHAWLMNGGGLELLNEFHKGYGVTMLPAGNTGAQMGGWFRKEIKSLADLSGVKWRIAGLAGRVVTKLGVVPQQLAGGDIYPALDKGTIDAAEFVGPYDDERLGLQKIAPNYYAPGWFEGSAMLHFFFNLEKFNALPKHYQSVLTSCAAAVTIDTTSKYDSRNPAAIKRLVAAGAQLRQYPQDVLDAAFKANSEVMAEISAQNANFKRVHDAFVAFRGDQYLWWQVAEASFDNFMIRARARG